MSVITNVCTESKLWIDVNYGSRISHLLFVIHLIIHLRFVVIYIYILDIKENVGYNKQKQKRGGGGSKFSNFD